MLVQPLTVKLDPRVSKVADADLALQSSMAKTLAGLAHDLTAARADLDKRITQNGQSPLQPQAAHLADLHTRVTALFVAITNVDAHPTDAQQASLASLSADTANSIAAIK